MDGSTIEYEDVYYMGNAREAALDAVDSLMRKEAQVERALDRAERLRAETKRGDTAGGDAARRIVQRMATTVYEAGVDIMSGLPVHEVVRPSRRFDLGLALTLLACGCLVAKDLN
jgi:hypothetical protein